MHPQPYSICPSIDKYVDFAVVHSLQNAGMTRRNHSGEWSLDSGGQSPTFHATCRQLYNCITVQVVQLSTVPTWHASSLTTECFSPTNEKGHWWKLALETVITRQVPNSKGCFCDLFSRRVRTPDAGLPVLVQGVQHHRNQSRSLHSTSRSLRYQNTRHN